MSDFPDIPQEWIRQYVNKLLNVAGTVDPKNYPELNKALLDRAQHALDLVQAFREGNCGN